MIELKLKSVFELRKRLCKWYIGVSDSSDVPLFYYFVKSESNPKSDSLILWLTEGPGCSVLSENALMLFRRLKHHGFIPQVVTYNTLIHGLCKSGRGKVAREFLNKLIESDHIPNAITYTTVMKCCFRYRQLEEGFKIFAEMRNKRYSTYDAFAYCTVANLSLKTGRITEANEYLGYIITSGFSLYIVSFNTIFNLYCKEGQLANAFKLLYKTKKRGLESDKYTHAILIDGLCKTGNLEEAHQQAGHLDYATQIFESMDMKDSVTHSTIVRGLCKVRRFRAASKLLISCIRGGMKIKLLLMVFVVVELRMKQRRSNLKFDWLSFCIINKEWCSTLPLIFVCLPSTYFTYCH
ncbi:hypothetical protein BC332_22008 [Capsicum chinense]|nr:hypothetical protein BC332_22008 [Capsicum chinense]